MDRRTAARVVDHRYEIVRGLGSGGMASVYEAVDRNLSRVVALKILHPHLRTTPLLRRFREEGRATARVRHPGIVTVFDTIETDSLSAIVMEYVPGCTLRALLDQRGPLPINQALSIARTLADALGAAHEVGVLHRDVKPANILVTPTWQVKITDFGIAKHDGIDLTATGSILGTARYMAPEQLRGERTDARTDVYGLATVCFEMLCGRTPFDGDNDATIALARLQSAAAAPRQFRADVPAMVDEALLRALSLDPAQRYASMRSFSHALDGLTKPSPANVDAPDIVSRRPGPATEIMAPSSPARPLPVGRMILFVILTAAVLLAFLLIVDSQTAQQALEKMFG